MGPRKNKMKGNKSYVVIGGRDGVPAIYTSWASAHPKVEGVSNACQKSFNTLNEAKAHMNSKGIFDFKTFDEADKKKLDKKDADSKPTQTGIEAYYAIACGKNAGVKPIYYNGAEPEVHGYPGNCHKRFKTLSEAEAFIEDWRNSIAEAYGRVIRKLLDEGIIPKDMNIEKRAKDMLLVDYEKKGNDISGQPNELKQQEESEQQGIVEGVEGLKLEPAIKQE